MGQGGPPIADSPEEDNAPKCRHLAISVLILQGFALILEAQNCLKLPYCMFCMDAALFSEQGLFYTTQTCTQADIVILTFQ